MIEIHTEDLALWIAWGKLTQMLGQAGWTPAEILIHLLETRANTED